MARPPRWEPTPQPACPAESLPTMSSLAQGLFVLSVLVLFTVSGGMLWTVGYNYDGLAGSGVTKIHPGTYLVFLTFGLAALQSGNPIAFAIEGFAERPGSLFLLTAAVIVFAEVVYRSGPGMAGIIDTYMLPGFVSVLFMACSRKTRARLEIVIHAAMIANALVGLVEFGSKHLIFPYRFDGVLNEQDGRPSALQGHPLGNATMTAVYLLALVGGGGTLSAPIRAGVVALQAMALVAFGGRSSIVVAPVLGMVAAFAGLHRAMRSGRVNLLGVAAVVLVLTAAPIIGIGLAAGGFFDALLTRFVSDGGSANARIEMLTVIQAIPLSDLIVGPDPALVGSLRRVNGLEEGIENPIIETMLYQGILFTGLLIVAVAGYLREAARVSGRGLFLSMLGFVILVNTFESLASKSTMLAKFAVMLLILFRPDRSIEPLPLSRKQGGTRHPGASIHDRPGTRRPAAAMSDGAAR